MSQTSAPESPEVLERTGSEIPPEQPEISPEIEPEEPVRPEVIETLEKPVNGSWTAIFAKVAEIFRRFYESIAKKN